MFIHCTYTLPRFYGVLSLHCFLFVEFLRVSMWFQGARPCNSGLQDHVAASSSEAATGRSPDHIGFFGWKKRTEFSQLCQWLQNDFWNPPENKWVEYLRPIKMVPILEFFIFQTIICQGTMFRCFFLGGKSMVISGWYFSHVQLGLCLNI